MSSISGEFVAGSNVRFNNIQILRVIAAVGVVIAHIGYHGEHAFGATASWVKVLQLGDWVGCPVPLLFAVSGFVLTHVLHATSTRQYLAARLIRLYPGYWFALGCTFVLIRCGLFDDAFLMLSKHVNRAELFLLPVGWGNCPYLLGIEWSLIYEFVMSMALAALGLFGVRRGVPVLAGLWLVVIALKMSLWPGFAFHHVPTWGTVFLSAFIVPFLLGVLAYYGRNRGHGWRWLVAAGIVALYAAAPLSIPFPELHWCQAAVAGAGVVWLSVNVRQLDAKNPLVRAGDWTYGLYLVHAPVMLIVFFRLRANDWLVGTSAAVLLAGLLALTLGFLFGKLECALHSQLRPLAKVKWGIVWERIRVAAMRRLRIGTRQVK